MMNTTTLLSALVLLLLLIATPCRADLYVQNPRGSNNRLAGTSANRRNGNRLFDSQNNNRGGYNVGERTNMRADDVKYPKSDPDGMASTETPAPLSGKQYNMLRYEGSALTVEWTSQHGCGGRESDDPNKVNCNLMLQYMCDTDDAVVTDAALRVRLRDGSSTNTPQRPDIKKDSGSAEIAAARVQNDAEEGTDRVRGRHESEAYYWECRLRDRNMGLFTADQRMNGRTKAVNTRQNRNGNQRGLECPEERDYWPYWAPSPWRDVAYISDDDARCERLRALSQNTASVFKCTDGDAAATRVRAMPIDEADCKDGTRRNSANQDTAVEGVWKGFTHGLAQPVCVAAQWSRDNHLGNARNSAQPQRYNWTLPTLDTLAASGVRLYGTGDNQFARCVMRLRYNISTDDYDPWTTDSDSNDGNAKKEVLSTLTPVQNDPTIDIGVPFKDDGNEGDGKPRGLKLAVNTAQFGRTFQDRSHVFRIARTPAAVVALQGSGKIVNVNVKGKRGNIVQTYPATEYDFMPGRVHVSPTDLLHVQWTGSNTHENNGGGDGQGGDAGEGARGTDRHNFAQLGSLSENFPLPLDTNLSINLFDNADCFDAKGAPLTPLDCQIRLATSGQFLSEAAVRAGQSRNSFTFENDKNRRSVTTDAATTVDPLLDTAPPTLEDGLFLRFKAIAGTKQRSYFYMSTRNNNFSNRSQKATIVVDEN